jgi:hypothetical protein
MYITVKHNKTLMLPSIMTEGAKRVAFADVNVKGSLCLTAMCMPILIRHSATEWIQ